MSALLKCNVLQQYLLEARVMSCSSNSCYKVLQGLTRMRARKSEQFIQLLRMNLVTGIVLYCKVLVSCRGPAYVTICKWYFKLNTLTYLNRYQTAFRVCHTEFGITPQRFAYEMISEKCKCKSYTVL